MDEEEDWDASPKNSPTKAQSIPTNPENNPLTSHITLKITDGYKYSYEALESPANIEDWVEPVSFGGSRRSNGFRDSFKDNNNRFRNNRFDPIKRNNLPNGPRNFESSKPNRFSNRPPPVEDWDAPRDTFDQIRPAAPIEDWDAPANNSANQMNGAWKTPIMNTPVAPAAADEDENWDDPPAPGSIHSTPKPADDIPIFNPSSELFQKSANSPPTYNSKPASSPPPFNSKPASFTNNNATQDNEENWDDSGENLNPPADIPIFDPNSTANTSIRSREPSPLRPTRVAAAPANNDEENWDDEPAEKPDTDIPIFNPSGSAAASPNASGDRFGQDTETRGFGNESRGFGNESRGFGNESRGFGNESRGFGKESRGFGHDSDRGFGQESRGFGSESRGFDNNWHSNKFSDQRGFGDGNERGFGRDFNRPSRGNFRHNPYDRNDRGGRGGRGGRGRGGDRGGRGGRGGRGSRDGYNSRDSFHSRDDSRNRGDRSFQRDSFGKRDNDRSFQSENSFNTVVQPEEDWDNPTGFKQNDSVNNDAPTGPPPTLVVPPISPPPQHPAADEESWD